MNITFKRIVCFLLVICLLNTLPGCATINGEPASLLEVAVYIVGGLIRGGILVIGNLALAGIVWVLDKITWPLYRITGFNMDGPATAMFKFFNNLVDPNHVHGNWDEFEVELHDEHPPTIWEKDKDQSDGIKTYRVPLMEKLLSKGNSGENSSTVGENQCVIHYDANGGFFAPEDQIISTDSSIVPKITKECPVREGYHFMGWTSDYSVDKVIEDLTSGAMHDCNTVEYRPGEKAETEERGRITEDVTLYAVWNERGLYENFGMPHPYDHVFTVEQVKENGKTTPNVSITCSCGMIVPEKDMLEIDFLIFCNKMKEPMKTSDAADLYKVYLAQDIGPLALYFNTEYFNENILFEQFDIGFAEINTKKLNLKPDFSEVFNTLGEHSRKMGKVTPAVQACYEKLQSGKIDKKTIEKMFKDISLEKSLDMASKAFSLVRLLVASGEMLDEDRDILEQTVSMLEVIESIASFSKFSSAVEDVSEVLQEGLKLIKKCEKTRKQYYKAMENGSKEMERGDGEILWPYIYDVMGRDDMGQAYFELTQTTTPGCTCGISDTCNFDVSGMCLDNYPDVAVVLYRMENSSVEPKPEEKEFLALYLAEKSRHELYKLTGLTLAQYAELVK